MTAKILIVDNPEGDGRDFSLKRAELGSSAEIVQLMYYDHKDLENLLPRHQSVTRYLLISHLSTAL